MAIGLARLGRMKGVKRPALSAIFPSMTGFTVVSVIGANVECKPEYLMQFALMGSVYAKKMLGANNPRVGLLSNGEEPGKGNQLVKDTYVMLENSNLNFIGNVEGKELFEGETDVVVTDGFTGNVMLKSSEAVAKFMADRLKEEIMNSFRNKIGALIAKPALTALKNTIDPAAVGAAPLLGLDGLVFVGHGRSNTRAMMSAIKMASEAVNIDLIKYLRDAIEQGLKFNNEMEPV